MDKKELLENIETSARERIVTRQEVMSAYDEGIDTAHDILFDSSQEMSISRRHFGISEILYYLGGGIVILGIGIFIGQNWDELNSFTRIFSTLGSAVLAYVIGILLSNDEARAKIDLAFHLIAGIIFPIGIFVSLYEFGIDENLFVSSVVFASLCIVYAFSYQIFKKNLFMTFWILFGTLFFLLFTSFLVDGSVNGILEDWEFSAYQFLIIGISFVLLGYAFTSWVEEKVLTKYLYVFGLVFFFGASLTLGGWTPEQNIFWELIYPGLALGATFLSIPLRSKAFLILGSCALIAYIFKITGEYFTDSLGWPLALVVAGFALIGVGAIFVHLNKTYRSLV